MIRGLIQTWMTWMVFLMNERPLYLLDSNVCIVYLKGRSEVLHRRFDEIDSHLVAVCSVVKAELFYGAKRSNNPAKALQEQRLFLDQFVSFPFDDVCSDIYGNIRADLAGLGTPIGANDLLIAAIALAHNLILVTHNTREFGRVERLQLEDWEIDMAKHP